MKFEKRLKSFKFRMLLFALIECIIFVCVTVFTFFADETIPTTVLPEHTEDFYVEDYSGVLNDMTESVIYSEAIELRKATKAQVCVVTVPDTHADSMETYSRNLANKWGIGDKDLDNGVLLLFVTDTQDPHVRLEVGRGLEGVIPDGKAGRILDDYAVDAKNAHDYNKAAGDTFLAVLSVIYEANGIETSYTPGAYDWENEEGYPIVKHFEDPAFPKMVQVQNPGTVMERIEDAMIGGLVMMLLSMVVLPMIFPFLLFGPGSGYGGGGRSNGRSSGGFFSGHSGGGGSFGGGGASR